MTDIDQLVSETSDLIISTRSYNHTTIIRRALLRAMAMEARSIADEYYFGDNWDVCSTFTKRLNARAAGLENEANHEHD